MTLQLTRTTTGRAAGTTPSPARRRWVLPAAMLTPSLVLVGGLLLYPIVRTIWLSFHDVGLADLATGTGPWVGTDNYRRLLGDGFFWTVMRNTVGLAVACVVLTMTLGTLVALLLQRLPKPVRVLVSIVVLLPWAMPRVAASIVWKWLFNDQYGVANWLLVHLGLGSFAGFSWFLDPLVAFTVITLMVVWQSFPFIAITMLAGLQAVPVEVVEAARVDGASGWRIFWSIIVPMLRPVILILVILSTIWDFKIFTQVYVLTEGGPARSTYVLGLYSWIESFTNLRLGYGAAIATVMLVILLGITTVYIRSMRRQGELL